MAGVLDLAIDIFATNAPPTTWRIYTDESRTSGKNPFMLFGCIALKDEALPDFETAIESFRLSRNMVREMKWAKVSNGKLNEYKEFADLFFDQMRRGNCHFHSLVVERQIVDYETYHEGDRDVGMGKLHFALLCSGVGRRYGRSGYMHVRIDDRKSRTGPTELMRILNNGMFSRFGVDTCPFLSVEAVDSKDFDLVQMVDVLIGAIGWQWNGHHKRSESSAAKSALAKHISRRAGLFRLDTETPFRRRNFTVWKWRPRT